MDYKRRVNVVLNGVNLQDAAPLVVAQVINEVTPDTDLVTVNNYAFAGQRFIRLRRKKKEIRIGCMIACVYDLQLRAAMQDALTKWAQDGILEVSYRPEQRLRVNVTSKPALGSVRDWTQELEVVFTANALPYWEDLYPTTVSLTAVAGQTASGSVVPPGSTAVIPVEVTVTNTGAGILNTVSVSAGDTAMEFSGLNIPAGGRLVLSYDNNMVLHITDSTTSKAHCRTAASDDNLLAVPGQSATFQVSGDSNVSAVFSMRGLWE
jgi:hypothetical protein